MFGVEVSGVVRFGGDDNFYFPMYFFVYTKSFWLARGLANLPNFYLNFLSNLNSTWTLLFLVLSTETFHLIVLLLLVVLPLDRLPGRFPFLLTVSETFSLVQNFSFRRESRVLKTWLLVYFGIIKVFFCDLRSPAGHFGENLLAVYGRLPSNKKHQNFRSLAFVWHERSGRKVNYRDRTVENPHNENCTY